MNDHPSEHPYTNRGVESPEKCFISLDWIELTSRGTTVSDIEELLNHPSINEQIGKSRFDSIMWFCKGVKIYQGLASEKNKIVNDMFFKIEISGKGVEYLTRHLNISDFELLQILDTLKPQKYGRIDIAIDVKNQALLPVVYRHTTKRSWVTRAKISNKSKRCSYIIEGENEEVQTCYIGARNSLVHMKIYDKRKEIMDNHSGHDIGMEMTRFELTLKDQVSNDDSKKRASKFVKEALSAGKFTWHDVARSRFLSYVDFKSHSSCRKFLEPKKAATAKWWFNIVGSTKTKFQTGRPKVLDFDDWAKYNDLQISKRVATTIEVLGVSHILKMYEMGLNAFDHFDMEKIQRLKQQKEEAENNLIDESTEFEIFTRMDKYEREHYLELEGENKKSYFNILNKKYQKDIEKEIIQEQQRQDSIQPASNYFTPEYDYDKMKKYVDEIKNRKKLE